MACLEIICTTKTQVSTTRALGLLQWALESPFPTTSSNPLAPILTPTLTPAPPLPPPTETPPSPPISNSPWAITRWCRPTSSSSRGGSSPSRKAAAAAAEAAKPPRSAMSCRMRKLMMRIVIPSRLGPPRIPLGGGDFLALGNHTLALKSLVKSLLTKELHLFIMMMPNNATRTHSHRFFHFLSLACYLLLHLHTH